MKYAVGIDVGGTNTRVALINEEYKILERIQFSTDSKDPEVTLNKIGEIIKGFGKEVEGIGISCPGPLDLIEGVVLTPPNLPGWHHLALSKRLEEITGVRVCLENDANLACLAEALEGAGAGKHFVQFLTISTGVGAGLCINGKIYHGAKGYGQEVANSVVWKNGPKQVLPITMVTPFKSILGDSASIIIAMPSSNKSTISASRITFSRAAASADNGAVIAPTPMHMESNRQPHKLVNFFIFIFITSLISQPYFINFRTKCRFYLNQSPPDKHCRP